MQTTIRKQKCGYQWMRVGHAGSGFTLAVALASAVVMIYLGLWIYREIPATAWRTIYFLGLVLSAILLYINLGVWLHEQLHCLPFRGTIHEKRVRIVYQRKYVLVLSGYYRVRGPLGYRVIRRALLAPLLLSVGLLALGWLGSLLLPGWWFPLLAMLAVVSVTDMLHDLYWVMQIRPVGDRGKYWDRGSTLEVVWKE